VSVDEKGHRADEISAARAAPARIGSAQTDSHLAAAELHADAAVTARAEFRFLENDFPLVGILGGEE